jgi:hypothetical protein
MALMLRPLPKRHRQRRQRPDEHPPRPRQQRTHHRLLQLSRQPLIKRHHRVLPRQK